MSHHWPIALRAAALTAVALLLLQLALVRVVASADVAVVLLVAAGTLALATAVGAATAVRRPTPGQAGGAVAGAATLPVVFVVVVALGGTPLLAALQLTGVVAGAAIGWLVLRARGR